LTGPTQGLALDALTGDLSVTDATLIQPGQRVLTLHTDTPASEVLSTLVLNFTR